MSARFPIYGELAEGQSWADVHFAVLTSGLRCSVDGVRVESTLSPDELEAARLERSVLLKVWVGPVQLNCLLRTRQR